MNFLDNLNSQQKKAVTHPAGPLLVLAGAGSGKTRVLTYRMAYLIKNLGVNPKNIIAITFTNKAAKEMKDRIKGLLVGTSDILVSTFHSACVRFLRIDINKLGYNRNFIIFDTQDQQVLIKECLKTLNIDDKKFAPATVLNYIGRAKDRLFPPIKCLDSAKDIREKTMARIYELYQKRLQESNALDFDDIIMKTVQLFKEFPPILSYYQNRFLHILVDEYQDTNMAQYELVRMMAAKHQNLCVVGDDDQSIYSFRGADIRNILEFEQDFPDATVIRLEQNYRSTQNILNAANDVIDHNFGRKKKTLWTDNGEGDKINLVSLEDERQEAYFIAREINDKVFRDNISYKDIAVLYRTNAQSRVLEEAMVKTGLPYKVIGGLRFYQRKEIKDILSYMRVIANPSDDVSLMRIINVPRRGIGAVTLNKLRAAAEERNRSIFDIITSMEDLPLSSALQNKLRKFHMMMEDFIRMSKTLTIPDLMNYILEQTGYMEELMNENTTEALSRTENLQEMIGAAMEFEHRTLGGDLEDFLTELALVSDVDDMEEEEQAVVLMTLHSAKGLEFPIVFLAGMDEGIFPHSRSLLDDNQLEEERRLCYVGITRARKKLYMTRAWQRSIYGNTSYYMASRFLNEIPPEYIVETSYGVNNNAETTRHEPEGLKNEGMPFQDNQPIGPIGPGDRVRHSKWGEGIVTDIDGIDEDAQISISFPSVGEKHLILKYAPIVKI
ncbi:MAG TPA: DNA helicase PcrA [Thermoanaerobacterales bacterium]|nr:DNA helicase PcrA [Thermoanaerobacterales bacterium]